MLRTLGRLRLKGTQLTRPTPLLILTYLGYEGGIHLRENVAELFWPFSPPNEFVLGTQGQQIVDAIYKKKPLKSWTSVRLPLLSPSHVELSDLEAILTDAHAELILHSFISEAQIKGTKGDYSFHYKLTSNMQIQCSGTDPISLSLNKLKSHLQKLSGFSPPLITRTPKSIESRAKLDLHDLREKIEFGTLDTGFKFEPFLDGIEGQLEKEGFQLGDRLAEWIEYTRLEVNTELSQYFLDYAAKWIDTEPTRAQRFALKAYELSSETNSDEVLKILAVTQYAEINTFRATLSDTKITPDLSEVKNRLPHSSIQHHARERAWLISQEHLGLTTTPSGARTRDTRVPSLGGRYNPETYVTTADDDKMLDFLKSGVRSSVIVGKSGSGKSNLLCHSYFEQESSGGVSLFLNARFFSSSDFREILERTLLRRLFQTDLIGEVTIPITLYIDAVNEFSYAGGPVALLSSIINYAYDNKADNIKIILSCRVETWREYIESYSISQPLDASKVRVLNISGFTAHNEKVRLYRKYQRYYKLLPESYTALSNDLTQMIELPFMMRMIAETYSNRSPNKKSHKIPRKLNYFEVFLLVTQTKLRDAVMLITPTDPKRELFQAEIQECLLAFASIVYEKITKADLLSGSSGEARDTTDAINTFQLNRESFTKYLSPFSKQANASAFHALVYLGLIEETVISKTNFWGRPTNITAYKFFHDQYSQFCLSAVLSKKVLGSLRNDSSDQHLLEVGDKIASLLSETRQTPLIAGAIEHWLHANMPSVGAIDPLIPLFDLLASKESGTAFYYVASFLHGLIEKNILSPKKLYHPLLKQCTPALKLILANHLSELWPNISKQQLTAFLTALDSQEDKEVIRALSDNFVELFSLYPREVISLLDEALKGGEDFPRALTHVATARKETFNHAAFVVNFATKTVISHATSEDKIRYIRQLLEQKYRLLLNTLLAEKPGFLSVLKRFLYQKLEEIGINEWNQALGVQGQNNKFFVEHRGVVQRDVLYEYYPYIVAVHNRDFEDIKFNGGKFEQLTLKMMAFEPGSIIGYEAAMLTSAALTEGLVDFDVVVNKLLVEDNPANLFCLNLITTIYAYMSPSKVNLIIQTVRDVIVPYLIESENHPEAIVGGVVGITAIAFGALESECEAILDLISDDVKMSQSSTRAASLTDQLINCVFHPNIEAAQFLIGYVVKNKWLDEPFLRTCGMGVLSAAFVRNANILSGDVVTLSNYDVILQEVKQGLTKELYARRDSMSYQTVWNRFIATAFKNTKVRYYLAKILTGGLLQSNKVEEYALEFRRFVVELTRGYFTDTDINYDFFTMDEAMRETEPKYVKGAGEEWTALNRPEFIQ